MRNKYGYFPRETGSLVSSQHGSLGGVRACIQTVGFEGDWDFFDLSSVVHGRCPFYSESQERTLE